MGQTAASVASGEANPASSETRAIDFPSSYLYCEPTGAGISVRVQMECRGSLIDVASGETDEYVMGVMAKTGLTPLASTGQKAPGYDYWIIFSKTHVFTKRTHSSAYLNNPTVLAHKDFGAANWRLDQVAAKSLQSAADVRAAIENWRRMSARTVFTSVDGQRHFALEYPVKWADYALKSDGFRVETGPVFLLNPEELHTGSPPEFGDIQWAHLDYHSFDRVRCLLEQPTSVLADATFTPPSEHGRENRKNPALTEAQVQEIRNALLSERGVSLPRETVDSLLSTDHYSRATESSVRHELYALID